MRARELQAIVAAILLTKIDKVDNAAMDLVATRAEALISKCDLADVDDDSDNDPEYDEDEEEDDDDDDEEDDEMDDDEINRQSDYIWPNKP